VREWTDTDGPGDALRAAAADLGLAGKRVLVDEVMPLSSYFLLEKAVSGFESVPGRPVMADLRVSKDPEELGAMKRASRIADRAFAAVLDRGIVGLTEAEVSLALKLEMLAQGADDISFEPIIAAGPNGAVGHHRPGLRVIAEGDAVIMDFGSRIDGYCSDVTRTVFCSSPSAEMEKVYEVVRSAQEAAVKTVKPGVTAEEIDRVANELVLASGMGTWHRTGHGIGLDIHEPPYIVTGNAQVLEKGMTFSVEPGIYLPGRFGVRVEDVVVATEQGSEAMSELTRSIVVVR
jgi:Xaa-Pro aminopeptidase